MSSNARPALAVFARLVLVAPIVQWLAVLLEVSVPHEAWRVGLSVVVVVRVLWLLNGPLEGLILLTSSREY